ncbi:MAG: hypothetical protein FWF50_06910 [Defluviitaleaceae bacterium]|nr:hypothetical protein [Defluviitaleaceae bacterium]
MINKAILIENIKRLLAIPIYFLIMIIAFAILPLHTTRDYYSTAWQVYHIIHHQNIFIVSSMVTMPLILAIFLHPFHFDKKVAINFYSLPIKKAELFLTNLATGLIFITALVLIVSVALLIPFNYSIEVHLSWESAIQDFTHDFSGTFLFFLRTLLGFIFYYAMFTLAMSLSANRLVGILFSIALMGFTFAATSFIYIISYLYIFGHPGFDDNQFISAVFSNPALLWTIIRGDLAISPFIIAYIILTFIFIILGYLATQKRRLEQVGTGMTFKWIENICTFLFSFFGAVISAAFLTALLESIIGIYIGLILGFLIFFIIGQMILEKSLQIKHRLKLLIPNAIIIVVLYGVFNFLHIFMAGYINRIPDINEVYAIEVDRNWFWDEEIRTLRKIRDEDAIRLAAILHESILESRSEYGAIPLQRMVGINRGIRFELIYHLHNGEVVHRAYYVPFDITHTEPFINLFSNDTVILRNFLTLTGVFDLSLVTVQLERLTENEFGWWNTEIKETQNITMNDTRLEPLIEAAREGLLKQTRQEVVTAEDGRNVLPLPRYQITLSIQTIENNIRFFSGDWVNIRIEYADQILELLEIELPNEAN